VAVDEDQIRRFELGAVRHLLPASGRLVEIGAGSGFQASILRGWGFDVAALDLPNRVRVATHHGVVEYDGGRVPFADESFDVAFSSNVLEHVFDLDTLIEELHRVLRPGGVAVHVMPTPTWRVATTATHPMKSVVKAAKGQRSVTVKAGSGTEVSSDASLMLRRALFAGPHGEFPSATAEIKRFSRSEWVRRLDRPGWAPTTTLSVGLFYTGSQLLPVLPIDWRRRFGQVLGGSTIAYRTTRI
jgi:SAM-dependent methyltransferase